MIKHNLLLLVYNKVVICVIDKGQSPICGTLPSSRRQSPLGGLPSHEPYIPRKNAALFTCTTKECQPLLLHSITQVTPNKKLMKTCFFDLSHRCETLKYHNFKNIDKLQFFADNVPDKKFYLADCLVYGDGSEVCHRKGIDDDRHDKLIDLGTIVKPNETNILSQDELLCEETTEKEVNCDFNLLTPSAKDSVGYRDLIPKKDNILLKSETFLIKLKYNCIEEWCGYSGRVPNPPLTRRNPPQYDPPGGKMFRCYYADTQQVCKRLDLDVIAAYHSNAL